MKRKIERVYTVKLYCHDNKNMVKCHVRAVNKETKSVSTWFDGIRTSDVINGFMRKPNLYNVPVIAIEPFYCSGSSEMGW